MISTDDLTFLQGRWRILTVEEDGEREEWISAEAPIVHIQGDEWIVEGEDPRIDRTQFHLESHRHSIDFLIAPGIVTPGVYRLKGVQLLVCCDVRAILPETRGQSFAAPTEFSTSVG